MTKLELAEYILDDLLDSGMVSLEYGQVFLDEGKQDCIRAIKNILDDYIIVEGRTVD